MRKMKIYNDNCLKTLQQLIKENVEVDLTVTSPPYDDLRSYKNTCQWNFDIFKNVANLLYGITKENGVVVWVVSDKTQKGSETGTSFKQALYFKEIGFSLYDTMIWQKPNPSVPTEGRYYNAFEYMFVLCKGLKPKALNLICDRKNKGFGNIYKSDTRMNPEQRKQKGVIKQISEFSRRHNVWSIPIGQNKTKHPAVFPLELALDHIKTWSNEGDVVLDPFMGSGTTGIACEQLNRHFIGIELCEEYFKIAKNRLENTNKQYKLL